MFKWEITLADLLNISYSHGETSFTNNTQIGKKVAIRFDSGRKLPQERREDIIDRARNLCLATGHFQPLLTN
jgi:hypothetical protein